MDNESLVGSMECRPQIGHYWTWSSNREEDEHWAGRGCLHLILKGSTLLVMMMSSKCTSAWLTEVEWTNIQLEVKKSRVLTSPLLLLGHKC